MDVNIMKNSPITQVARGEAGNSRNSSSSSKLQDDEEERIARNGRLIDKTDTTSKPVRPTKKGEHNSNSSSADAASSTKKPGFFRALFCCFFPSAADATETPYDRSELTSNEPDSVEYLLPPLSPRMRGRKTLVLDLDETLVHASFKEVPNADFIIPVEIENQVLNVYVLKRPAVEQFLRAVGALYEVVLFTASLPQYADPLLDLLDTHKVISARLFRDACTLHKTNFVKDLGRLGRELKSTIIIDNSPASYLFHPENAVPIESWYDDPNDTELLDLIPFLEDMSKVDDVRDILGNSNRGA